MRKAWLLVGALWLALASCGGSAAEDTVASSEPTEATTVATTIATTTTSTEPTTTTTTEPAPSLTAESNVTLRALGPVVIGMSVEEAATASGLELSGEFDPEISDTCYYVSPDATMKGVSFMVFEDIIARIEIEEPSTVTTRSGAGIGTTKDELLEMYPDNLQDANEAVFDGVAVGFVPNDDSDADYRIFFELDEDDVVTRFRVGVKPAVDFIEGCS